MSAHPDSRLPVSAALDRGARAAHGEHLWWAELSVGLLVAGFGAGVLLTPLRTYVATLVDGLGDFFEPFGYGNPSGSLGAVVVGVAALFVGSCLTTATLRSWALARRDQARFLALPQGWREAYWAEYLARRQAERDAAAREREAARNEEAERRAAERSMPWWGWLLVILVMLLVTVGGAWLIHVTGGQPLPPG